MQGKNRYFRRSHLSEAKFRMVIRYFAHDLAASKIAELTAVSRPTINQLLFKLRTRIAQICDASSPLSGEVEVDESYFGARRVRGKKGRGAGGKTMVFGILERQGEVYTEIVPDASKKQLQAAIRGQVAPDSIIHSDGWRGYNGLVDMGYKKHLRVHHGKEVIAISMALNHSGHTPNADLLSSMAFHREPFIFIARNVNSDLIIERKIYMIEYSLC